MVERFQLPNRENQSLLQAGKNPYVYVFIDIYIHMWIGVSYIVMASRPYDFIYSL